MWGMTLTAEHGTRVPTVDINLGMRLAVVPAPPAIVIAYSMATTTPASWLRPYETRNGELYKRVELVEAHALSLFASADELSRARDITPWMARKSVAEVTLTTSDGHLRHAPSAEGDSHHDWWTNPHDLMPDAVVVEASREVAA